MADYTNNYDYNKIIWNDFIELHSPSKSNIVDEVFYTLDTESTNVEDKECITYATQLMKFGKKIYKTGKMSFVPPNKRQLHLFTHPDKFWEYVHNCSEQKITIYLFNAEFDINNILNYAIRKYKLIEEQANLIPIEEYECMYSMKDVKLTNEDSYKYQKLSRDGRIYSATIHLGLCENGKTKSVKRIKFIDMAKKMPGTLRECVESFTPLKMNKSDLDYTIFRDFGHTNYKDEELLYMWNDVYCLAELVMEYCYSTIEIENENGTFSNIPKFPHSEKLTSSSMALNCNKDELCLDMIEALENNEHKLHNLSLEYFNMCKDSRISYMTANLTSSKFDKMNKRYNNLILKYGEEVGTKKFIISEYYEPKEVFTWIYPQLCYEDFEYIFPSYCGGITRFKNKTQCGKWIKKDGIGIDINSSFPYSYTYKLMPYGNGKRVDEVEGKFTLNPNKLYVIKFTVNSFELKNNCEANIQKRMTNLPLSIKAKLDTWIPKCETRTIITCTSVDYEYFRNNYNFKGMKINSYIEYNCILGLFDRFTNKFYTIKQTTKDKGLKAWSKLCLNGNYGKYGQNSVFQYRVDEYDENLNCINDILKRSDNGDLMEVLADNVYLPIATFVTSYSRIHLLTVLNIVNKTKGINWVYCDTDSSYIIGSDEIVKKALIDYIDIDYTGQLGKWKIEKYFSKILIVGIKKYIYFGDEHKDKPFSYHATLSGINRKYFSYIEEYCNIDDMCIQPISKKDKEYIILCQDGEKEYYTNGDNCPFIYKDKECTKRVNGAYRSIRKKVVKNGQILHETIYSIKGDN